MKSLCSLNVISGSERHLLVNLKGHLKKCITQSLFSLCSCHYDSSHYKHNEYWYIQGSPIHGLPLYTTQSHTKSENLLELKMVIPWKFVRETLPAL